MYERTENLTEYHGVVAESIISIINLIGKGDTQNAKKVLKFDIIQAYVLYRMDNVEERTRLESKIDASKPEFKDLATVLKNETITFLKTFQTEADPLDTMVIDMFIYQSLAGIKPVQNVKQRARGYERIKTRLGP